jgi:hypothetical protein
LIQESRWEALKPLKINGLTDALITKKPPNPKVVSTIPLTEKNNYLL